MSGAVNTIDFMEALFLPLKPSPHSATLTTRTDSGGAPPESDDLASRFAASGSLRLTVTRPDHRPGTVVVHAAGDLDAGTAPALRELLWPRLNCAARTVVLDLSQLTFLSVSAVRVLNEARLHAHTRQIDLRLVSGVRCVDHALSVVCASRRFTCHPTLADALGHIEPPRSRPAGHWAGGRQTRGAASMP